MISHIAQIIALEVTVMGLMEVNKTLIIVGLFAATVNAEVFTAWLEQDLLPKLPSGCVIVMDNATFHTRSDTQSQICKAGHILEYLPAYSPRSQSH
jgi:transposase